MAEPTLKDVIKQLKENNESLKAQNAEVSNAVIALGKAIKGLTGNKNLKDLDDLETKREKRSSRTEADKNKGRTSGSRFGRIGGGLAGAGIGLGAMGAGIGAFFLGLAGAEGIMSKFGTGDNLKKMMVNMAEGLGAFSNRDLVALGAVLGAGALFGAVPIISGMGAGVGVAAIGLGIGAFFSGLAAGDMAIGAMESTGKNLAQFMGNFADGLGKLATSDMIMLGGLLAAGAGFGALFGVGKSGKAAIGMALIGAGIAGFFTALGAGDMAIGAMKATGESLSAVIENLATSLGALDNEQLIKVAGLLAPGAALAAFFGIGKTGKVAAGMAIFATGFATSLTAMAAIPAAAEKAGLGSGEEFKKLVTNIGEGFAAFDDKGFKLISIALAGGGGAGAFFGPKVIGKALVGLAGVGAGIGLFISSLAIAGGIPDLFGVDGSTFKTVVSNIGEGLKPLNDLDSGLIGKVSALGLVGPAIASLILGLGAKAGLDAAFKTFTKVWNFITGADNTTNADEARKNQLVAIVESLEPLKDLDVNVARKMDTIASSLTTFANAIKTLAGVNINQFKKGFNQIAESLAGQIQILTALANGGPIDKKGIFSYFSSPLDFKNGILDPSLKLDELTQQIAKAQFVLGQRSSPFLIDDSMRGMTLNQALAEREAAGGGAGAPVIITDARQDTRVENSGATVVTGGGSNNPDAFRMRYGAQ